MVGVTLGGAKVWEIRPRQALKRERTALAQTQASLLLGDVEVVD